jgi:hypothetical protein
MQILAFNVLEKLRLQHYATNRRKLATVQFGYRSFCHETSGQTAQASCHGPPCRGLVVTASNTLLSYQF